MADLPFPIRPIDTVAPIITFREFLETFRPDIAKKMDEAGHSTVLLINEVIDLSEIMFEAVTEGDVNSAHFYRENILRSCPPIPLSSIVQNTQGFHPGYGANPTAFEHRIKSYKKELAISQMLTPEQWRIHDLYHLLFDPINRETHAFSPEMQKNILAVIEDYESGRIQVVKDHFYVYRQGQRSAGPIPFTEKSNYIFGLSKNAKLGQPWFEEVVMILARGFQMNLSVNSSIALHKQQLQGWELRNEVRLNGFYEWFSRARNIQKEKERAQLVTQAVKDESVASTDSISLKRDHDDEERNDEERNDNKRVRREIQEEPQSLGRQRKREETALDIPMVKHKDHEDNQDNKLKIVKSEEDPDQRLAKSKIKTEDEGNKLFAQATLADKNEARKRRRRVEAMESVKQPLVKEPKPEDEDVKPERNLTPIPLIPLDQNLLACLIASNENVLRQKRQQRRMREMNGARQEANQEAIPAPHVQRRRYGNS
ncbi:hypothetical protein ABW20_dc0108313 [Dactylellina cionopaga]|nr:hypothetical protein ABW20_dc0108313 [Dactylellina cionopaga]